MRSLGVRGFGAERTKLQTEIPFWRSSRKGRCSYKVNHASMFEAGKDFRVHGEAMRRRSPPPPAHLDAQDPRMLITTPLPLLHVSRPQ